MKTHVSLPWNKTDIAAAKLYDYVKTHTDILQQQHVVNVVTNIDDVMQHVPELVEFFAEHKVTPKFGVVFYAKPDKTFPPHIDSGKIKRFLFPVFNCQGTRTEFYRVSSNDTVLITLENGRQYYDVKITPPYDVLDWFELNQPVVLDTSLPHGVSRDCSTDLPRISFTVAANESLDHFLE